MNMTLRQVLDLLQTQGLYDPSDEERAVEILCDTHRERTSPWYIQGLIGAGAWLAAVMFLIFFFGSLFAGIREEAVFIIAGLFITACAVTLLKKLPDALFATQFALAIGLAGQIMFAVGVGATFRDVATAAGALCVLEILLVLWCRNRVHLFLSILIATTSVVVMIFDLEIINLIHVLVILLAAGCVAIMTKGQLLARRDLSILARALAFSLLNVLILSAFSEFREFGLQSLDISWWISTLGLLVILLLVLIHTLENMEIPLTSRTALILMAGTLVLSLLSWRSPGILAGLLILTLGFARVDRFLMGLGLLFIPAFIIVSYYNLDLTLLQKSGALVGPGILLLIFRIILRGHTPILGEEPHSA